MGLAGFGAVLASVTRATQEATASFGALASAAEAAAPAIDKVTNSISGAAAASEDLIQQLAAASHGGGGDPDADRKAREVSGLQRLESRIESVFGTNNEFAGIIKRRIELVQSGQQSIDDALRYLQGALGAYAPGLAQEALSSDPAVRAMAQALQRFISSGALS